MIVHMVLLRIRRNVQMREVEHVFAAVAALQKRIPGISGVSWGANSGPRMMSSLDEPAGTIGNTPSRGSTRKSITTLRSSTA